MEELFKELLESIVDNDVASFKSIFEQGKGKWLQSDGDKALGWAAKSHCNTEVIGTLLKAGADAKANHSLPLIQAVQNNQIEAAKLLLEYGANPNERKGEALQTTVYHSNKEMFNLLESFGADIHHDNDDLLAYTTYHNNHEMMKFLHGKGLDVHADDCKALKAVFSGINVFVDQDDSQYNQEKQKTIETLIIDCKLKIDKATQEWIDQQGDDFIKDTIKKTVLYEKLNQMHPPKKAKAKVQSLKI
jgi:hypothetical protein